MFRTGCAMLLFLSACFLAGAQQATAPTPSIGSIESLIRSKEYDRALQALKSPLQQTPDDSRLWTLEGIALSLQGNKTDAIAAFDKALKLSPNYPPALKGDVQLLYSAQDKRAIPLLKKILRADPKDETAHEMLAVLDKKQGDCPAAVDHFHLSAEVIGTHPESLEAYGDCLMQMGKPQEAVPVFQQLVTVLPQRTYPKYDLAVVLVATRQNEAALKILEPLLDADQSDPELLSLASEAYEGTGNTPKAVSLLRQAIVINPANTGYYTAFASICMSHESFQVGIDMINAGLQRIAGDPSLYLARGMLYAQLAQYDKAEDDFNSAEQLDSAQSISSFATDLAELQMNHDDQALKKVREQLKIHPESPLLHFILAKLLADQGPSAESDAAEEAIESAHQAVKLNPDMVEARDLLASMYLRAGKYDLAIAQCRLALQTAPTDQSAIYHLITALRHAGKGQSEEMQALVKRLSELQKASLQQENERKRYKLVEQESAPPK
jgi:tetratricopeptide (TPR) repeat protein